MEYKDIVIFILSLLTSVSEVLPYIKEVDSNGILQLITNNIKRKGYKLIKDIEEDIEEVIQENIQENTQDFINETLSEIQEHQSLNKTQEIADEDLTPDKFMIMKVERPKIEPVPTQNEEENLTQRFQLLEDGINAKYNQLEINISCYYNELFKILENKISEQDLKIKILSEKIQN